MDNQQQYTEPLDKERHIDYGFLFKTLLKYKKLYYKVLSVTFVFGCFIALSIPKEYTCEVLLAPELSTRRTTASISALASQMGLKMGSGTLGNTEALYPNLYPDLVNSTDFKVSLFSIPVHQQDSTRIMSYYEYLRDEQKMPWWSMAMKSVSDYGGYLVSLIVEKDSVDEDHIDPFQLTKLQSKIVKSLEKSIVCEVDEKTLEISITVIDQDPLICATMADSVKARLQKFITEYQTKKSRVDVDFNRKLCEEAKARYDEAREKYAVYSDAHQDMIYQSDRTELINLENDMQLKYNAYNSVAQQLIAAEAKVQEATPSFTTLQSATVPVKKSGPGRVKIVLVFMFLAFLGTSAWVLYKEDQLKPLLGLS